MRAKLILDVIGLAVYAAVSLPAITTIGVHEWLGLGVFAVLMVHVAQHGAWVSSALILRGQRASWGRQGRLVLDALIAVVLTVCVVSGLMVSGAVLPAFGWYAEGYFFWDPLHSTSAKMLLALIALHVALNLGVVWRLWRGSPKEADGNDGA